MSGRITVLRERLQDAGYSLIRKRDGKTYVIARPPAGPLSRDLSGIDALASFAAILGVWTPGARHD